MAAKRLGSASPVWWGFPQCAFEVASCWPALAPPRLLRVAAGSPLAKIVFHSTVHLKTFRRCWGFSPGILHLRSRWPGSEAAGYQVRLWVYLAQRGHLKTGSGSPGYGPSHHGLSADKAAFHPIGPVGHVGEIRPVKLASAHQDRPVRVFHFTIHLRALAGGAGD